MRKKLLSFLTLISLLSWCPAHAEKPSKQPYANVWYPIDTNGIREGIKRNRDNGVGLEQIMMRAMLQRKASEYLSAIQTESKAEPDNPILIAAFGWALAETKLSYGSQAKKVPAELANKFNFEEQNIRDTLQHARDIDPKSWMAYIGEAILFSGGVAGRPTRAAALCKKAFDIQRNSITMTHYGAELLFEAALTKDQKKSDDGLKILLEANKLYPTYYRSNLELYYAYGYRRQRNPAKRQLAGQRFLSSIPPTSRNLPWVKRYLDFLEINKRS